MSQNITKLKLVVYRLGNFTQLLGTRLILLSLCCMAIGGFYVLIFLAMHNLATMLCIIIFVKNNINGNYKLHGICFDCFLPVKIANWYLCATQPPHTTQRRPHHVMQHDKKVTSLRQMAHNSSKTIELQFVPFPS